MRKRLLLLGSIIVVCSILVGCSSEPSDEEIAATVEGQSLLIRLFQQTCQPANRRRRLYPHLL